MNVPLHLRRLPAAAPAEALLLYSHTVADVLDFCARLGTDPLPRIHAVAETGRTRGLQGSAEDIDPVPGYRRWIESRWQDLVAARFGPIVVDADLIKIGANNTEYSFSPARTRVKTGTTLSFTNVGDIPHDASGLQPDNSWSIGVLAKGETKTVKFDKPGIYYYICSPHPWMYGQVVVE